MVVSSENDIGRFSGLRSDSNANYCGTLHPARIEPLKGEARDFARVFQIQFVFDMRSVGFHGFWAQMQHLRDLTHFVALADQFRNFQFAIAQSLDSVGLSFGLAMCELCDYLRRHGRAEIRTSIKNFANCVDYI